jgi:hypothetical protein
MARSGYRGGTSLAPPLLLTAFTLVFAGVLVPVAQQARQDARIQRGVAATAAIEGVRIEQSGTGSDRSYDTYLAIRFRAQADQLARASVHVTGRHTEYAAGQEVAIRYDAAHPAQAEIPGKPAVGWTGLTVAVLFWLALAAFTAYAWRARARAVRAR